MALADLARPQTTEVATPTLSDAEEHDLTMAHTAQGAARCLRTHARHGPDQLDALITFHTLRGYLIHLAMADGRTYTRARAYAEFLISLQTAC